VLKNLAEAITGTGPGARFPSGFCAEAPIIRPQSCLQRDGSLTSSLTALSGSRAMIQTVPTTVAGIAALVSRIFECECLGVQFSNLHMPDAPPSKGALDLSEGYGALLRTLDTALAAEAHGKISRAAGQLLECGSTLPDIYFDGIGRIDTNGPISHLVLYMCQHDEMSGAIRVKVVTLIVPTHELPIMARQLAASDDPKEKRPQVDTAAFPVGAICWMKLKRQKGRPLIEAAFSIVA
jgi:hypothetical protein